MNPCVSRLRYKSLKIIKEDLSLPSIPENVALYIPQTSSTRRHASAKIYEEEEKISPQ
jgi:hypothetical protein